MFSIRRNQVEEPLETVEIDIGKIKQNFHSWTLQKFKDLKDSPKNYERMCGSDLDLKDQIKTHYALSSRIFRRT